MANLYWFCFGFFGFILIYGIPVYILTNKEKG